METEKMGEKLMEFKKKIMIILLVRYMQFLDLKIIPALDFYLDI